MGTRSGGGGMGGRNAYRATFNSLYNTTLNEINGVITDVTSKSRYYKSAAQYLKNEVLGEIDTKALSQAKQLIKQNHFAHLTPNDQSIIQKGARTKAAMKLKSKIEKALKSV